MALTATTLAAAIDANVLIFKATSATGATVGGFAKIDDEYSFITAINGTQISVRTRGDLGSKAETHNILAPVLFGLTSDMPDLGRGEASPTPVESADLQSYGADGAIDVTKILLPKTTIVINKATAAAMTLAAPNASINGYEVTILSGTAAAHTVTYTAGFYGDTTSSDVATFAAKAGASMTIVARQGTWGVIALANVTLA